ncbi:hypothetical protein MY1884_002017 [Beauveria asiatica]
MLLKEMEIYRSDTLRPVIFIAHSYGGLVLMQAIRRSFENPDKWSSLFRCTAGLVFFGTPFRGRRGLSLAQIVEAVAQHNPDISIYPDTMALSVEENPYLQNLVNRFTETRRGDHPIPLWCFYETQPSPIRKTLRNDSLEDNYLIPQESACLDLSKNVKRHPLERHHYNLQKFPGPSDAGYRAVEDALLRLATGAREYLKKCSAGSQEHRKQRHFLVPFGRNEAFVGRDVVLDALRKRIPPTAHPNDCQRTALEGLGGIGKTQIALEAAYSIHDAYPDCSVFWVPAVDPASLEKAYRDIGQALGVKGLNDEKADVRVLVHAALTRDDAGPWLWIIDNADDWELLFGKPWTLKNLPFNRNGSVLVTTRNHEVAIRLDVPKPGLFKVDKMHRAESAKLLYWGLDESQIDDTMSTSALLDFLTDLPLAVKQASAYMAERNMSTARYLGHCQSSNKTLIRLLSKDFGDRGRYETTHNPVATTWLISFEYLSRDAPLAADYLRFVSFLSEKNIPRSLLPDEDDELEADEALGTLQAYAFVTERLDTGWFDVHRLVRLVMHNWLAEKGEQVACLTKVINRLDKIYPIPEHDNKDVWMDYLSHAQAALETRAEAADKSRTSNLLLKVGQSSYKLGQYAAAEATYHKSLELRIKVLGAEHPYTLISMNNLGQALDGQGQYAAAEAMHRKALELRIKVLGAEHPDTLGSVNALALALQRQGQYAAAEAMHRKALKLRTKVLGAEHSDTLISMNNLGQALDWQGQYAAAEAMHRKVLKLRTEVLGAEHSDTLISMNNLGQALDRQGQCAAAEAMHRKALELRTKVLGAEHPNTFISMHNLALALDGQGQYAAAEAMHRRVLELRTKVLGAEHPNTLIGMNNLALALDRQGQYAAAEAMHRKVLELGTKVLGAEHPNTLISMHNLALVLYGQGQYAAAEAMHRKVLELGTKVLGAEHPYTLISMNNLALALDGQGQYAAAEVMHRKVLELKTKVLGAEHPSTLISMNDLARALYGQGQYASAEAVHRKVLELKTEVLGAEHPDTLDSMNDLARALDGQGQYAAAEAMHRKVLELWTKVLGAEHPNTLTSMNDLARALYGQGQYAAGEAMHRKVLELMTKVLGAEHPNTLESRNGLIAMLRMQGKYAQTNDFRLNAA